MKKRFHLLLTAVLLIFTNGCYYPNNSVGTASTTAAKPTESLPPETLLTNEDIMEVLDKFEVDLNNDGIMEQYTTVAIGVNTNFPKFYIKGYDPSDDKTYVLWRESESVLRFCIHHGTLYVVEFVLGEDKPRIYKPTLVGQKHTFWLEPVSRELELDVIKGYYAQQLLAD